MFKFRNPSRSTFHRSIFRIPPENFQFEKFQKLLIGKLTYFPNNKLTIQ